MKIFKLTNIRSTFLGILFLSALPLFAQQNNSLYFMDQLPQSNQLNPATQPFFGFYLGLPGISSIEVNGGNSALGFHDVIRFNSQLDSTVYFLNSQQAQRDLLSRFKKTNFVYTDGRIDLITLGLRINKNYYSFNISERMEVRLNLPYDLVKFMLRGNLDSMDVNAPTQTFDLSTLGIKATWYREYALGFSREIDDKITFGLRGKLLFGKANITTQSSVTMANTGYQSWEPHSTIDVNSSIPDLNVVTNSKSEIDSLKFKDVKDANSIRNIAMNKANMGVALDLGFIYKPVHFFSIAASVVDLGYINWKNNLHHLSQDGSYNMEGVILHRPDSIKPLTALLDTLKSKFAYNTTVDPYMTTLSPKLYVGMQLRVLNDVGLSVLTRMQIIEKSLQSQYTFSLNFYPGNVFLLTLSYTIADNMYDNFGAALSSKFGPLQWYIMTDRIPLYYAKDVKGYYVPEYAKNINLRFGVNIVFGKKRHKRIFKDQPLVEIQ